MGLPTSSGGVPMCFGGLPMNDTNGCCIPCLNCTTAGQPSSVTVSGFEGTFPPCDNDGISFGIAHWSGVLICNENPGSDPGYWEPAGNGIYGQLWDLTFSDGSVGGLGNTQLTCGGGLYSLTFSFSSGYVTYQRSSSASPLGIYTVHAYAGDTDCAPAPATMTVS